MVAIQHGTVTVSIADEFTPPAQAGNLGPEEVRRIAKAQRGIGLACDGAADALEKSGTKFRRAGGRDAGFAACAGQARRGDRSGDPRSRGHHEQEERSGLDLG